MDQKKDIKLYHHGDITIEDVREYHTRILQNHLNPPLLEQHANDLIGASALITPTHIYEQTLKQSIKDKEKVTQATTFE
jgi:hypothetical protein